MKYSIKRFSFQESVISSSESSEMINGKPVKGHIKKEAWKNTNGRIVGEKKVKRFSWFGGSDSEDLGKELFENLGNVEIDPQVAKVYKKYPEDLQRFVSILRKYKIGTLYKRPDLGKITRFFAGPYCPNPMLWEDTGKKPPKLLYKDIPGTLILVTNMNGSTGDSNILRWDENLKKYTISICEPYGFDFLGKAVDKATGKILDRKDYYQYSYKTLAEALKNF